eukprot:3291844-Prymnesium_polylepis.2
MFGIGCCRWQQRAGVAHDDTRFSRDRGGSSVFSDVALEPRVDIVHVFACLVFKYTCGLCTHSRLALGLGTPGEVRVAPHRVAPPITEPFHGQVGIFTPLSLITRVVTQNISSDLDVGRRPKLKSDEIFCVTTL